MSNKDTIAAVATPSGRGGVGIIRVSGSLVPVIAQALLGRIPEPREATYLSFQDSLGQCLDKGVALFFPAPRSFTGEDVLELQGHGGVIVLDCLLQQVLAMGARIAQPGEFSERAFLNDKMDLVQAEAIADLIDASSERAARSALRSLQGDFSRQVHSMVAQLIQLRLYIEAAIDFPAEEIDFISDGMVQKDLEAIIHSIKILRDSARQGTLLRDGMTAVIVGNPNVGKSSLLNNLSGKDTAIVTPIPGTTRDMLHELVHIDGMPLHIMDTAGLRETNDIVEKEGIRRTYLAIQQADVILWMTDSSIEQEVVMDIPLDKKIPLILVRNKIDLVGELPSIKQQGDYTIISLSAKFQQGLDLLKGALKQLVGFTSNSEGLFTARRRHLTALDNALDYLKKGHQQLTIQYSSELLAEDLRHAQYALSEITGEFTADDLLGKIFSSFCIGK